MTFVPPKVHPDSYQWLSEQDINTIEYLTVMQCLYNYVEFMQTMGMQTMEPTAFFQPGDLQTLCNVVNDWPAMDNAPRLPGLADLLLSIKITEGYPPQAFAQVLDGFVQRCRRWLVEHNHNPDKPNETPKERQKRLAAARVRRWRERMSDADVSDPDEMALVRALRAAQDNAKACRKWVRKQEAAAKAAYDAAVAQAKLARSTTVSTAQAWLPQVDQAVAEAEHTLSAYRVNK